MKHKTLFERSLTTYANRRRFLQLSAATVSTIALSNCARKIGQTPKTDSTASNPSTSASSEAQSLYLYTWADYLSQELNQRFQEKTGIKVITDVYESNETMLAKLQAGGGAQYSIIYPSDYMVRQMVEANLLLPLDLAKLKGIENLMERWKDPVYDPKLGHSIPFNWGTTGLIYNSELISTAPTDWNYLWENQQALSGKITLIDDFRETIGMALKSLGYSYNATDPAQIEAAYQKLLQLKPDLAGFKSFGWEDQLAGGDFAICMSPSTLGNSLPLENSQLKYVIPQSGTSLWTDTIAIPAIAPNLEAAYAWINFLLEPENAAFAATQLKLGSPNQAAFKLLPPQVQQDTNLYPTAAIQQAGEGIMPVGDAIDLYEQYWTQLKSA